MWISLRYGLIGPVVLALLAACGGQPEPTPGEGAVAGTAPGTEAVAPQPDSRAATDGVTETAPDAAEAVTSGTGSASGTVTRRPREANGRAAEPSAPPVTGGAAPAPAPVAQQDDGARALRAAAAAYERVRSLQAEFTMRTENPLLRAQTTSRGMLYQRQPDRILLRFTEPAGDVIVGDGTHFWVYYPSTDPDQVIRAPADEAGTGGVDLQAQFVGDPVERFRYTLHDPESVDGRSAQVLTLVPRDNVGYRSLKVWIDNRDSLVRRFEITEPNGVVRRFDLRELQVNPTLGDALFRFSPPAGVRVVERN